MFFKAENAKTGDKGALVREKYYVHNKQGIGLTCSYSYRNVMSYLRAYLWLSAYVPKFFLAFLNYTPNKKPKQYPLPFFFS